MQTLGRYRILHRIASGGMADVYRAMASGQEGFEKEVVIKRMRPELAGDPAFGTMFVQEARIAATLTHANIVQVLDFGNADGEFFMVMESVHGRDLRQVLDRLAAEGSLLPFEIALLVVTDVARALDYAHRRTGPDGRPLGIVHRDVSPQNVLISFEGEVKLTDFGIAKLADPLYVTAAGAIKGKLTFMSPEQAAGGQVDQRSDIFSLGILLYQMLTGRNPFEGGGFLEVLERVKRAEVPPPTREDAEIPPQLLDVLLRCTRRDPTERYENSGEVLRALEAVARGLPSPATATDLAALMRKLFPEDTGTPVLFLDRIFEEDLGLGNQPVIAATKTDLLVAPTEERSLALREHKAGGSHGAPLLESHTVNAQSDAQKGQLAGQNDNGEHLSARGSALEPQPIRRRWRLLAAAAGAATLVAAMLGVVLPRLAARLYPARHEAVLETSPQARNEPSLRPSGGPSAGPGIVAPSSAPSAMSASQPREANEARTQPSSRSQSVRVSASGEGTGIARQERTGTRAGGKTRGNASERPRGYARFRTDPAYAEVWVRGSHRCNTPCILELEQGTYEVRLFNPVLKREVRQKVTVTAQNSADRPADVMVSGFR